MELLAVPNNAAVWARSIYFSEAPTVAAGQESHCQLCHTVGLSCVSALPLSAVLSADSPCLSCVSALPLPAFLCAVGLRGVGAAGDGRDRPAHWRG